MTDEYVLHNAHTEFDPIEGWLLISDGPCTQNEINEFKQRKENKMSNSLVKKEEQYLVIQSQEKANIDLQISTAKAYPRQIGLIKQALFELIQEAPETCYYKLPPRDEKIIEGPSIRMAEYLMSTVGNLHCGVRTIAVDEKTVTAQAVVWDLESNNRLTEEVSRSIFGKYGRYSENLIQVTAAAARSIALRNAIFRVVPRSIWIEAYEKSKKLAGGDIREIDTTRSKMIAAYKTIGVAEKDLLAHVGKTSVEDLTMDDITTLRGAYTAIKDGDMSKEEIFNSAQAKEEPKPQPQTEVKKVKKQNNAKPETLWEMNGNGSKESNGSDKTKEREPGSDG